MQPMEDPPVWGSEEDEREFARLWPSWNGEAEQRDRRAAVRGLTKLAEGGYAPAQYALGMAFFDGEGVRRNYPKAFEWLMRSAERGYPGAQNMVGSFYGSVTPNYGVCEHSPVQAVQWYEGAAGAGNAAAQFNLATAYWSGLGVERDLVHTCVWARLAVHCSPIRFRPAEVLRDRAAAELSPQDLGRVEVRVREMEAALPRIWSEPRVYWRDLAERHGCVS